jgi:hypothetical protein
VRNLLAFLAAAALAFFGLGWYLDWYKVQSTPADSGHRSVTIDVNARKIGNDLQKGGDKLHDALDKTADEAGKRAETGKPEPSKN